MFSPELMRYIIDPNKCPKGSKSKLILKNSKSEYNENLKRDVSALKTSTNSGIKLYRRLLKALHKTGSNFERE